MWRLSDEQNDTRCRAVGPPVGWRVVCHACRHRFPIFPGAPGSGGASVLRCCSHPQRHIHDLRIPCEFCAEPTDQVIVIDDKTHPAAVRAEALGYAAHMLGVAEKHHGPFADPFDLEEEP